MPGKVVVVPKLSEELVAANDDDDEEEGDDDHANEMPARKAVGSLALVDRTDANRNADGTLKNPGYPFWIGGMESSVGNLVPGRYLHGFNGFDHRALLLLEKASEASEQFEIEQPARQFGLAGNKTQAQTG